MIFKNNIRCRTFFIQIWSTNVPVLQMYNKIAFKKVPGTDNFLYVINLICHIH